MASSFPVRFKEIIENILDDIKHPNLGRNCVMWFRFGSKREEFADVDEMTAELLFEADLTEKYGVDFQSCGSGLYLHMNRGARSDACFLVYDMGQFLFHMILGNVGKISVCPSLPYAERHPDDVVFTNDLMLEISRGIGLIQGFSAGYTRRMFNNESDEYHIKVSGQSAPAEFSRMQKLKRKFFLSHVTGRRIPSDIAVITASNDGHVSLKDYDPKTLFTLADDLKKLFTEKTDKVMRHMRSIGKKLEHGRTQSDYPFLYRFDNPYREIGLFVGRLIKNENKMNFISAKLQKFQLEQKLMLWDSNSGARLQVIVSENRILVYPHESAAMPLYFKLESFIQEHIDAELIPL